MKINNRDVEDKDEYQPYRHMPKLAFNSTSGYPFTLFIPYSTYSRATHMLLSLVTLRIELHAATISIST